MTLLLNLIKVIFSSDAACQHSCLFHTGQLKIDLVQAGFFCIRIEEYFYSMIDLMKNTNRKRDENFQETLPSPAAASYSLMRAMQTASEREKTAAGETKYQEEENYGTGSGNEGKD